MDAPLTKRQFLQGTAAIFSTALSPALLSSVVNQVAETLELPPDSVREIFGAENDASDESGSEDSEAPSDDDVEEEPEHAEEANGVKQPKGGKKGEKKEKAKRGVTSWNVYTAWFGDFAAHYGLHPAIVAFKQQHPEAKLGVSFAATFFKTIPEPKREAFHTALTGFLKDYNGDHKAGGDGTTLDAIRAYEAAHPGASIGRMLGLEARPAYKTEPEQMKAEAAQARKSAAGVTPGATPAAHAAAQATDSSDSSDEDEEPASTPAAPPTATAQPAGGEGKKRKSEAEAQANGTKDKDKSGKKKDKEGSKWAKKAEKESEKARKAEEDGAGDKAAKKAKKAKREGAEAEADDGRKSAKKSKKDEGEKAVKSAKKEKSEKKADKGK
ncbi:hypothetical protein HYH03_009404 [Edaphochlamys debaryana]|uniref:Uncharacterized protein n=1 Tax=Edaphochlamys debaryana TaxID=47281 RepID=A0A836BYM3_9CHLO|nr:hypothetical protein HYH03_009404 [Edaphochlamys debaryana]|eukprot:KAG2492463.1 hypothetical protein HYH03_009404 [Edaphochlamys debaryana]